MKDIVLCIGLIGFGLSGVSTCVIASRRDDASVRATRYLPTAIDKRDMSEIKRLMQEGAKCTVSALRHAVRVGDTNIISELLNNGGREIINSQESSIGGMRETALSEAMQGISTDTEVVKLLLDNGARADIKDWLGETVFYIAVKCCVGEEVIQLLLDKGGRECINVRNNGGITPLMMAASLGRIETVKLLLANGADKSIKSKDGETALDMAVENNHSEVANLLRTDAR